MVSSMARAQTRVTAPRTVSPAAVAVESVVDESVVLSEVVIGEGVVPGESVSAGIVMGATAIGEAVVGVAVLCKTVVGVAVLCKTVVGVAVLCKTVVGETVVGTMVGPPSVLPSHGPGMLVSGQTKSCMRPVALTRPPTLRRLMQQPTSVTVVSQLRQHESIEVPLAVKLQAMVALSMLDITSGK